MYEKIDVESLLRQGTKLSPHKLTFNQNKNIIFIEKDINGNMIT